MDTPRRYHLSFWKGMFFLIMAVGAVATVIRLADGLGAVTNLSDSYPWGLWKSFNVLVAIGLGGAGFTIMGAVYIFHAKRLESIVRPTVVMAFLAYFSAAISLAIVWPELRYTLIESIAKKARFLAEAATALGLNLTVVNVRAEDAGRASEHRVGYDLVTARAVAAETGARVLTVDPLAPHYVAELRRFGATLMDAEGREADGRGMK